MNWLDYVYLISFITGLTFGLLSFIFSGLGGSHDGDGHHVIGTDATTDHGVHMSPLSPITITMFIATFGGVGYLLKTVAGLSAWYHIPLSILSGLAVAITLFLILARIFLVTQASSVPLGVETVGTEADVQIAIPADGVGEIGYVVRESRLNAPAKTVDGKPLPANTIVRIVDIVGGICVVEKVRGA